jgi:preprotein translocase subunit Sec63
MGPSEAAEILGVRPGASRDEVRQHYQKIYNDFQIRLTNAPTAALKRMYQKNLQDLKAAADLLAPGLVAELKA